MFKKMIAGFGWFSVQKNKSMEGHFPLIYFFFFLSLLFINCIKDDKKPDRSNTLGLLGIAAGTQTSTGSDDDQVLPPIPPIVGPPAGPGGPLNPPILNDIQAQVINAPNEDDPFKKLGKVFIDNITFQLPVHSQTTITSYVGRRNMKIDNDGNVSNALHYSTKTPSNAINGVIQFSFLINSDLKLKIILLARNEFGSSFKEVTFSHNRSCSNANLFPTTIGDCEDHCIKALTNEDGKMEFQSKYKHDNLDFLNMDIIGIDPLDEHDLTYYRYFFYNGNAPLPLGSTSVSTKIREFGENYTCMLLSSEVIEEKNNILNHRHLEGLIRIE
ncbi:hypothetical protein [Leptospira vanthielii]|uniref:hypothetical protein n=1 Tax=Leptospira vanthielii TaxID=293085 RepID=UPI001E53C12C|nr:hypothetical protein [Leptospira vanthielii]